MRRGRLSAFAAAAAACGGCLVPSPVLRRPPEFQRGVALGLFSVDPEGQAERYEAQLEEVRALGATDVSLVLTWVQRDVHDTEVRVDAFYTARDPVVRRVVRRAHALGMRVLLFPILRLLRRTPSEWRGTIRPRDPARWFATYGALLASLATLAAEERVEVFSVGSELASLEHRAGDWRRLIAEVRRLYPGTLTYSANWDHYAEVPFWSALDRIGVSAYWEVAPPGRRPVVDEAARAWGPIRERLVAFTRRAGMPLLLSEVGYPSVRGAGTWPWNDFLTGEDGEEDGEAQRRLYQAFTEAWTDEPALAGVYFWYWYPAGGLGDRSYTPRHKPAEHVLRAWYRSDRPIPR